MLARCKVIPIEETAPNIDPGAKFHHLLAYLNIETSCGYDVLVKKHKYTNI